MHFCDNDRLCLHAVLYSSAEGAVLSHGLGDRVTQLALASHVIAGLSLEAAALKASPVSRTQKAGISAHSRLTQCGGAEIKRPTDRPDRRVFPMKYDTDCFH